MIITQNPLLDTRDIRTQKAAQLIRAFLRRSGMTQIELARAVGVSQAEISKAQKGAHMLRSHALLQFMDLSGFTPKTFAKGFHVAPKTPLLENERPALFQLPPLFRFDRGSGGMALFAVNKIISAQHDGDLSGFLASLGIDQDYFVYADNSVNWEYPRRAWAQLVQAGLANDETLEATSSAVVEMMSRLNPAKGPLPVAAADLVQKISALEVNQSYELAHVSKNHVDIRVKPRAHLIFTKWETTARLLMCENLARFVRKALESLTGQRLRLEHKQCIHRGDSSCVYQVQSNCRDVHKIPDYQTNNSEPFSNIREYTNTAKIEIFPGSVLENPVLHSLKPSLLRND